LVYTPLYIIIKVQNSVWYLIQVTMTYNYYVLYAVYCMSHDTGYSLMTRITQVFKSITIKLVLLALITHAIHFYTLA